MTTGYAVSLVLVGGVFLYGFLYNYMYDPNVVRNAPVAVVDMSHTPLSRRFVRMVDSSPMTHVVTENPDLPEARRLMEAGEIVGFLYLPADFDERIGRGEEAVYVTLATTAAFLYYASVHEASAGAMLALGEEVRPGMAVFLSQEAVEMLLSAPAVSVEGIPLYNPAGGYGTYLIPSVLMVIIFQTLVMVVFMQSGKEWHTGATARYVRFGLTWRGMAAVVAGKTLACLLPYAVFSLFLLGWMPLLFDLPHLARGWEVAALMAPFLPATCFFALSLSFVCTDSDAPLLLVTFFSVGLIFLSGVSWPLERMPLCWRFLHALLPAPPATLAFVQLVSMDAGMAGIAREWLLLWLQAVGYFLLACGVWRFRVKRACRKSQSDKKD